MQPFYQILCPERDRISRPPIDNWLHTLSKDYDLKVLNSDNSNRFEELEVILNNLSLIFFYLKEVQMAEFVCQGMRKYLYDVYYKNHLFDCPNKYGVIQPWINLIRIDRFQGNKDAALEKLDQLVCRGGIYSLGSLNMNAVRLSDQAKSFITFCYIDEKSKLLLAQSAFEELQNFVALCLQNFTLHPQQINFFLEIKSIMMARDMPENIISFLSSIIQELSFEEGKYFQLKQAHYLLMTKDHQGVLKILDQILEQKFIHDKTPIYDLRFWINVAYCYLEIGFKHQAYKIFDEIYHYFSGYNDELSLYEISLKFNESSESHINWLDIKNNSTYGLIAKNQFKDQRWYQDAHKFWERIQRDLKNNFQPLNQEDRAC